LAHMRLNCNTPVVSARYIAGWCILLLVMLTLTLHQGFFFPSQAPVYAQQER